MENNLPPPRNPHPLPVNPSGPLPARVRVTVEVPPGSCLAIEIEARTPSGDVLARHALWVDEAGLHTDGPPAGSLPAEAVHAAAPTLRARARAWLAAWPAWLMGGSILTYLITRLVGLNRFPIYFFTDEAVQTMLAADFLRDHLHNYAKDFLPTFFQNGSQYNLGLSVYLQALPYLFFGKSIWVTRGTAAVVTLLAAVCVGLALKKGFGSPYPWLAVMFLAITPAWFLHSRTAFETGLATTFYAAFLYFYLLYRCENPRYLYATVVMAALAFYSYSPARLVIGVASILLFLSDFGYHRRHPRHLLLGFGLLLLLALPLARFLLSHPTEFGWQMRLLGSYWLQDMPLSSKLARYAQEYLRGLDPLYWYLPHTQDLARHTMPGYGHLLKYSLPLGLFGLGLVLANLKKPAYRALLITILAAPAGAAMVAVGITRVMFMVVPMALVTALAASWLMEHAQRRWRLSRPLLAGMVFVLLAAGNLAMLRDALLNGPTWERNYTLTGMQWGARQLFSAVPAYISAHPGVDLRVSPSWANGTDVLARFFVDEPLSFTIGSAESYYHQVGDLSDQTVFVLIPEEFESLPREKFAQVQVDQVLPYPDGRPGFYFVRLKYVDNIAEVLAAEEEQHRQPVQGSLLLDGQDVRFSHSRLDIGEILHLFDHDAGTLVRSAAINPLVVVFEFPSPRAMQAVELEVGGSPTQVKIAVLVDQQAAPLVFEQSVSEVPLPRTVLVDLQGQRQVRSLRLEVTNLGDSSTGNVHLWAVAFR